MSKAFAAVFGLLLLAPAAAAQVKGPADVTVAVGRLAAVPLTVEGDESDYKVLGTDVDAFREYSPDPKQLRLRLIGYAPGTAYVVVACVKGGKLQPLHTVTVTVTGVGPQPPPGPTPGPGPAPGPTPPPEPRPENPFGAMPGLRVLIVYETAETAKLPREQQQILHGGKTRMYLDGKCAVGPDGKTKEYRIFDKDVDAAGEAAHWGAALNRADRTALPWVYIGKESSGFSGPLPATPDAFLALLKKYAGD
jgi:hypothetical protein